MGRNQIVAVASVGLLMATLVGGCSTGQQARPNEVSHAPTIVPTHRASSADSMEVELERTGKCLRERLTESKVNTLRVLVFSARQSMGTHALPDLQVPFDYRPQVEIVLARLGIRFLFVQEHKVPAEMRKWLGKRAPTLIIRSSIDGMSGLITSQTTSREWRAGFGGGRGEGSVSSQMISEAVSGSVHASTSIYRLVYRENDLSDAEYYGIQAVPVKVTYQRLTNSNDYGADVYVVGGGTSVRSVKVFGGVEAALFGVRWSVMEALSSLIGIKLPQVCTVRAKEFDLASLTTYQMIPSTPVAGRIQPARTGGAKPRAVAHRKLKSSTSCGQRRRVNPAHQTDVCASRVKDK